MENLWLVNKLLTKNFVIRVYFKNNQIGEKLLDIRESIILKDFKIRYSKILQKYSDYGEPEDKISRQTPIWIFWGQGEEQMPPLVHSCYQSIIKNAQKHPVYLVTMKNYHKYIAVPEYIINKLKGGKITWATFSDIIRVALLSKWGGIWLDATIYMTRPFPDGMYNGSFFSVGHPATYGMVRLEPSRCNWRMFLMAAVREHFMMCCWRDLFYAYEKDFDYLIDYFLVDYFLRLQKETNSAVNAILNKIQQIPMNIYNLQNIINTAYSKEIFLELKESSFFYKMSYRGTFKTVTEDGKDTFYKVLFS